MTTTRFARIVKLAGIAALIAFAVAMISIAFSPTLALAEETTPLGGAKNAAYVNPDTGYMIVIQDDFDLLTDDEEASLVEDMKPITEYGHIGFWSTDTKAADEIDQARLKRKELFGFDSASVFVINMGVRKLTIQSYGYMYEYISDSLARSITDNVSDYAHDKEYYDAAKTAYNQIYNILEGYDIPEPMKLTGYAVLAIILGFTIALLIAFSTRHNPIRRPLPDAEWEKAKPGDVAKEFATLLGTAFMLPLHAIFDRLPSGGGGGGGSSSSGCSSCGSSGCSSCGGCGGGGSSSF